MCQVLLLGEELCAGKGLGRTLCNNGNFWLTMDESVNTDETLHLRYNHFTLHKLYFNTQKK